MNAIGQDKTPGAKHPVVVTPGTTMVLNYKFDGGGASISVIATSFDGACNVTVSRSSAAGSMKRTGPMDADALAKLMQGVSEIKAITEARITEHVPAGVDTETHHIITTLTRTTDGSKTEMYAVPEKEAPEPFRDWLNLLLNALPKA